MLFNKKQKDDYVSTKEFPKLIAFNENERTFKVNKKVYSFDDLADVDLIIDGHSTTKGGLGKMVAGGILLGPLGAIIGGVTAKKKNSEVIDSMKIVLQLNDFQNPKEEIVIFKTPLKKSGTLYKILEPYAQDIMGTFEYILRNR